MVYSLRFFSLSSKCSLFHNSSVFGSCIIHILYIYSTNIGTEYFKHGIFSSFFLSSKCSLFHNSNVFGSCIIHILYTGCAKIKKNNSGVERLMIKAKCLLVFVDVSENQIAEKSNCYIWQGQGIFLFSETPKPTLGLTQPPIK